MLLENRLVQVVVEQLVVLEERLLVCVFCVVGSSCNTDRLLAVRSQCQGKMGGNPRCQLPSLSLQPQTPAGGKQLTLALTDLHRLNSCPCEVSTSVCGLVLVIVVCPCLCEVESREGWSVRLGVSLCVVLVYECFVLVCECVVVVCECVVLVCECFVLVCE